MVVVGVEVLLLGVKFDGDEFVCGVTVGGGVGEAEELAVAVVRDGGRSRDEEGDAFAGRVVLGTENVDEKGGVEGNEFSV